MQASLETLFVRYRTTGQPEPLGELFDRVSPQLLALALHLCGHPADAEDALQATFVAAIDRGARWNPQRPLLPWLCGVLDKQCRRIGQRRARRRERELPEEPLGLDDGSPLAATERRELVAKLREHIDRLPVEQRQVLLLQLEHGLAPAEVAEVLAVPPGTVRMRLHRGLQTLRGVLPASLVALLLAALPSRGIAAVRAAVVGHALASAAMIVGGGALMTKKLALVAVVVCLLAGTWMLAAPWLFGPDLVPALDTPVRIAGTQATNGGPAADAPADPGAAVARVASPPPGIPAPDAALTTGSLRIVARAAGSQAPVANLPLRLFRLGGDVEPRFDFVCAITGADGSVVVPGLAPGRVRAVVVADGMAEGVVVAGIETTLVVSLSNQSPPRRVRGVVRYADGRAAAGATIVVGPPYTAFAEPVARADAVGSFAFEVSFPMVSIGARLAGHSPSSLQMLPANRDDVVIVLPGAEAIVAGLVVGPGGTPVGEARIEVGAPRRGGAWEQDGRIWEAAPPYRLRSDVDGRFEVAELPAGDVSVFVHADGFAPFHCFVTLQAGVRTGVTCELVPGQVVHGRVVDQRGEPVAGARVYLGGSYGEQRTTDTEGRFAYRHVSAGRPQRLLVEADDIVSRQVERGAEQQDEWRVEVERAVSYRLRFVDDTARPLAEWQVRLQSAFDRVGATDADGRVVLPALGSGPFRLWVGTPDSLQAVLPCAWPDALPGVECSVVVAATSMPSGSLRGGLVDADGAPWTGGWLTLRGADGRFVCQQPLTSSTFTVASIPPGDWVLGVHREQIGCAVLRLPVLALRHGEARDLGELRLPREGSLRVRVTYPDGREAKGAHVFLLDASGSESTVPPCDGGEHAMPVGSYRWQVMEDDALWQRGTIEVRVGERALLDVVLLPGVRRYVCFPVPRPEWGTPSKVAFVLRAPDGSAYDEGDFDPRDEMPYRYMPALSVGAWRLELALDDGRRFTGSFAIESLAPSRTPIEVAVTPSR